MLAIACEREDSFLSMPTCARAWSRDFLPVSHCGKFATMSFRCPCSLALAVIIGSRKFALAFPSRFGLVSCAASILSLACSSNMGFRVRATSARWLPRFHLFVGRELGELGRVRFRLWSLCKIFHIFHHARRVHQLIRSRPVAPAG